MKSKMKEKKAVLLKIQLRQILRTKAAKESNLQRLGMYYIFGFVKLVKLFVFNELY